MRLLPASLLLALCVTPAAAADEPPAEAPIANVDPTGRPRQLSDKPKGPLYYVWYEDGLWHLRTRTPERAYSFTGTIRARNGRLQPMEVAGLEPPGRNRRKFGDRVRKAGQSGLEFELRTMGRIDGFDIRILGSDVEAVDFDLRIDGTAAPKRILIGENGQRPPDGVFALPPNPAAAE